MPTPSLRQRRTAVERAWSRWQDGGPAGLQPEVEGSWERSARAIGLDLTSAPSELDQTVFDAWRASDLHQSVQRYQEQLTQIATDGSFVVAVTNPEATILWTTGSRHMRDRAARANFTEGGKWDEASVGTNALDLALRTRTSQMVFSAEHYAPLIHNWVCYSSPITDPRTGQMLGVLDLSTTWDRAHPLAMSTTVALANLLERDLSTLTLRPQTGVLELSLLGQAMAHYDGQRISLSRRQIETCALLAMHPNGMSLEELQAKLYGDAGGSLSTVKAEVSHLRQLFGGAVASRPYRLQMAVQCDATAVVAALQAGKFTVAMSAYGGELLPMSDSPHIAELRNWIEVALRVAALQSTDINALSRFVEAHPYDLAVAEHLAALVAATDPRYPTVMAQVLRARAE